MTLANLAKGHRLTFRKVEYTIFVSFSASLKKATCYFCVSIDPCVLGQTTHTPPKLLLPGPLLRIRSNIFELRIIYRSVEEENTSGTVNCYLQIRNQFRSEFNFKFYLSISFSESKIKDHDAPTR